MGKKTLKPAMVYELSGRQGFRRVVLTLSDETAMQLTKEAYAARMSRSQLADILLLKQLRKESKNVKERG